MKAFPAQPPLCHLAPARLEQGMGPASLQGAGQWAGNLSDQLKAILINLRSGEGHPALTEA